MLSSSIDLAALPDDLARQVRSTIDLYEAKHLSKDSWGYILDHGTDEDIMRKAQEECYTNAPLVFAKDYPPNVGERYCGIREVVPYKYTSHPRRPVAMRGGKIVRYWRHSLTSSPTANGWATRVFERALRMTKKTLLDYVEIYDFCQELASRVASMHPTVSYHFWDRCTPNRNWCGPDRRMILMSGKLTSVPHDQFTGIERMFNIIRKTDKLEERLRLARESRRY